jgi:uncharacterized OB-fold protein
MSATETKPLPQAPGAAFEGFLRAGEFRLQCCTSCSRQIFYPRTLCHYCGCGALEWRHASGRGIVYSTTTVRQKPERGGDYNVAIIELAEGARMLSRVEGLPASQIRIGMPVTAVISDANGAPLVVFRPAANG